MRAAPVSQRPRAAKARRHLLASASLISLLAGTSAQAADILRSNVTAAPITASAASQAAAQQAALAAQRAQETLGRTTQALQAMQAAQSAAHAMALSVASSVPNGLGTGGLQVVSNPVVAAQDATGLNTWQGADAPTQTNDTSGHANVTVKQNDSRAILSWQSFNVGKDTTLTYDQQDNKDWVALNRVVGADASPSQILGNIKADGTVLILNQNGIVFGGSSQINVNSLIATTLDIGRAADQDAANDTARTIAQRNQEFLSYGLLGYADANTGSGIVNSTLAVDADQAGIGKVTYRSAGAISVQEGAELGGGENGYVLIAAPNIENAGHITATDGQVVLAGGDQVILNRATGAADSASPGLLGFFPVVRNLKGRAVSVINDAPGLIESPRGSILLFAADMNSVTINQGGLFSTTSISRNGAIELSAANVEVAPDSILAITPDDSGETIPQDSDSLANFRPSQILVGNLLTQATTPVDTAALIEIGQNSLIYAPAGNITIGASSGGSNNKTSLLTSRVFVDAGAVIDASGLKDVLIPASRNQIKISPLKNNELADSPQYKDSFLNGATVYVDPRLSGVRDDGVAWIGSPLIDAASYKQQVGVSVSELMTKGGNVTLGVEAFSGNGPVSNAPDVIVKSGAVIDISGGWTTYQGGKVQTTQLVTSDGRVVDIGNANLDDTYVGIYGGHIVSHSRWGITETYAEPFGFDTHYAPSYTEGGDAGSLTIKGSAARLDGTIYGQAFPGVRQTLDHVDGTGQATVYGDTRSLQMAPSQLPSGGFLFVQAETPDFQTGGGDILVQSADNYQKASDSLVFGQTPQVGADGTIIIPARSPQSLLSDAQLSTIELSDALLSNSGFAQVSLATSGAVTVAKNAIISLNPGGEFDITAGRKVTIDGSVSVPSGTISLSTFDSRGVSAGGSVFSTATPQIGDFDIVVNGTLSARGRWVNDFGLATDDMVGASWLDGGSVGIYAAPRVSTIFDTSGDTSPEMATDLSGSVLINPGATIDVSGGGRVDQLGHLDTSAKGGNVSLYDETSYFQIADGNQDGSAGALSGFRVHGLFYNTSVGSSSYVPVNPDKVNAHVSIDPDAIRAQGFAGGGTFTLTAPEFAFGNNDGISSTELPLDFFSIAGFANYNITSYKTDLIANSFNSGMGGTDAVLATQTLTIKSGQVLALTQSMLPSVLDSAQLASLRGLVTDGDLFSVLSPSVPLNAWDRRAANLTLGGLLELEVSAGGQIVGDAGAQLTVSKLYSQGSIRLPGGMIDQREVLPALYAKDGALGVHALSDIFSINADGSIDENAPSLVTGLTNGELAGAGVANISTPHPIYFLGNLDAQQGILLAPGSVTDLSGASIRNPYAENGIGGALIATGRMIDGGTIASAPVAALPGKYIFQSTVNSTYAFLIQQVAPATHNGITTSLLDGAELGLDFTAAPGARIDLSGAADIYDEPTGNLQISSNNRGYISTPVWSNAGTLSAQAGATLAGATIAARGGAPEAENGTLVLLDPILVQTDSAAPSKNVISADMLAASGFDTVVALGSLTGRGDVTVNLGRALFLEDRPAVVDGTLLVSNNLVPTIHSDGGALTVNAPYIGFVSQFDTLSALPTGATGNGTVDFNADTIGVTGVLVLDPSVGQATLRAKNDIQLIGVAPWQSTFFPGFTISPALTGAIIGGGDINFVAAQIYPTTGSSFAITSTGPSSTITFGRSGNEAPSAPYSAGGNLLIQAANIVQGGIIRVPLGTLTLGGNSDYISAGLDLAPPTQTLTLAGGGITSVSAGGLTIPYGTTTDQTEWYFAPTESDPLKAPPQKLLTLNGIDVTVAKGAGVDVSGGGDVFAYEFIPGTGGSRDVLSQRNPDVFTGNNGFQYADGRQVYAIVPGLSDKPIAPNDPVYSENYANISSPVGAGARVWLDGGNGIAAGWYTLLPAQYALLPGGMRIVEETSATNVSTSVSARQQDGALLMAGFYGDALSGSKQSQPRLFNVQPQSVFETESNISQTTGNAYFSALATHGGVSIPQLPLDAGHLVLNPGSTLAVDSVVNSAPGSGGRGAQVDIGGSSIDILSALPGSLPDDGVVRIAATSLTNLGADSLLVGGTRSDNADGTTTLNVAANNIQISNDGSAPLSAHEIVLAATSGIILDDGASLVATGMLSDARVGAYEIGSDTASGTGAFLRVANGPERLVARVDNTDAASLKVGAATLSGTAIGFDSSGAVALAPNLSLQNANNISIGAPRIGFGADPATYDGLVITGALENLLTQGGAKLTLRSQSTIDFAGGDYNFGNIGFDAASISSLDNGDVSIHGGTISLGNVGAAGKICLTCGGGTGALTIDADAVVFTGGAISTNASKVNTAVNVTLASDVTITLPIGTQTGNGILTAPAQIVIPAGTQIAAPAGTGMILPAGADGTVSAGTTETLTKLTATLAAGSSFYFPNGTKTGTVTQNAGTYSLSTSMSTTLPAGTQTVLGADASTALTEFFAGGVTLSAHNGVFAEGAGSVLDTGPASLTIHTPYIGDSAAALSAGTHATIPDLHLASTGAVSIDNAASQTFKEPDGIPGTSVMIDGQSISISGTDIRATAGKVAIQSATGIVLSDAATIETPGYAKVFGDSVDSTMQNAPGGSLLLAARNGDLTLGDAMLSVGSGSGDAGTLSLSAPNGSVNLDAATLNGVGGAGGAGGSFALDSHGAVDLVALNNRIGTDGFTGGFTVHSSTGDLILVAGQSLKGRAINITADGGVVDIAGSIDTSGTNGGDISIYGRSGVTVEGSARIDASATGYAVDDTRQAKGGAVTLGTDFIVSITNPDGSIGGTSGVINIARGAVIDVSAKRPGDRLVPYYANGTKYYTYVQSDEGGTVNLRAPVTTPSGTASLNVTVADAGSIVGASAINLVGFKRWDLAAVASSGQFSGVTVNGDTVTLNVSTDLDTANADGSLTSVGGVNFLGDKSAAGGSQTLVDFVQNYDVSAAYSSLGGLASQSNFHSQPGMDLTASGNITLASNWNLGAGIVKQTGPGGAMAAGVMAIDPALNKPVVVAGKEAELLSDYTSMFYRTGGTVFGEPGVLSLRAGKILDIKGSITDGFFQFGDQTDPTYLAQVGVTNNSVVLAMDSGCSTSTCTATALAGIKDWSLWSASANAFSLGLSKFDFGFVPSGSSAPTVAVPPYSSIANSPAALGSFPSGVGAGKSSIANGGDPLGSAVVFPLVTDVSGAPRPVTSWSYDLVAAADLAAGPASLPSADPTRVNQNVRADLIVEGTSSYTYAKLSSSTVVASGFDVDTKPTSWFQGVKVTDAGIDASNWLSQFSALYAGVSDDAIGTLYFDAGANSPTVPGTPSTTLAGLIFGTPATMAAPATGSWLGQFIMNNGLSSGLGTLNSATGVYNGYRIAPVSGTKIQLYMPVYWLKQFFQQYILPNISTIESITFPCPAATCKTGTAGAPVTAYTKTLVRTGTGNISIASPGDVNLQNGSLNRGFLSITGSTSGTAQIGGTSVYTAGHPALSSTVTVTDPDTGAPVTIDVTGNGAGAGNLNQAASYGYGLKQGTNVTSIPGVLIANPVSLEGGGDVSVIAGNDILGLRDAWLAQSMGTIPQTNYTWVGATDEPWRTGAVGSDTHAAINPQLFTDGLGALGGGDINVAAGRNVTDLSIIASDSLQTANAVGDALPTKALVSFGSGNVNVFAGNDVLGGRVDIASGAGLIAAGGDIAAAGSIPSNIALQNLLRLHISDATVEIQAGGDITIQGVSSLGPRQVNFGSGASSSALLNDLNASTFYSEKAGLDIVGNGAVTIANGDDGLITSAQAAGGTGRLRQAVYPGTLEAISMAGDLDIQTNNVSPASVLLVPSPVGQLDLLAGGNILPSTIAMLDADHGQLPGMFSAFNAGLTAGGGIITGTALAFPTVLPSTSDSARLLLHNQSAPHLNDPDPVRIVAGGDIGAGDSGLILSLPKQARIEAGQDIVDMMFFGQNLTGSDVTRIAAGRDITATTSIIQPISFNGSTQVSGSPEPALQGNTFVIGGPGSFILEAGRDMGPFLNSATVKSYGSISTAPAPIETYGGGVLSVGNEWNPWLPQQGASISVLFGVAGGVNYDGFRETYLDPANLASMPDYLFEQTQMNIVAGRVTGTTTEADRSKPIYGPELIQWMQTNDPTGLNAAYGTTGVSYEQAYTVFAAMPTLNQQAFLNQIYFSELKATSDPTNQSYLKYARGYQAVNSLFPAADGYTQNDLTGGSNGANATIETGNLDLRLATIQTEWGGDITIMGPGGRVVAGSTVLTSEQAARRTFAGHRLFAGYLTDDGSLPPSAINAIPSGYEGILTQRGGNISTFTDGDFLLNQSRLFTEQGGEIVMWSSNAGLNAGQGPKTSANFPPVIVKIDQDLFSQLDQVGATTGAGIAALQTSPDAPASSVYLIAPRGTVDLGDAGVRVSGDLSIAALNVANADNVQVGGKSFGIPAAAVVDTGALSAASNAAAAVAQSAITPVSQPTNTDLPSIITVEVLGYGGGPDDAGNR